MPSDRQQQDTPRKNLRKLSHNLSWALRHAAVELGLSIGEDGYVPVDEILESKHPKLRGWSLEDIQEVVRSNDKQRFKMEQPERGQWYIRANQGHSIPGIDPNALLTQLSSEELASLPVIVHGTYQQPYQSIANEGLRRMNRNHIHFATGMPNDEGVISGMRKSCDVFIFVNAKKCAEAGIVFYRSENEVLLSAGLNNDGTLPIEFFAYVLDARGNMLLDQRVQADR